MIKVDVVLNDALLGELQSHLKYIVGNNAGELLPVTKVAFKQCTKMIQDSWRNWALGGNLDGIKPIKKPNARLAASVKTKFINDFDVIIENNSKYAEVIEKGSPEVDMKKTYPYGKKSRVSKKGVPYLIIPFRWGTPNKNGGERSHFGNTIPEAVYNIVKNKKFSKSSRTENTHFEKNFKDVDIRRSEYTWGDKLNTDENSSGNLELDSRMQGMVKMTSEVGRGSTYFTFRVISANSKEGSWIRQAVEGVDVASALENNLMPKVNEIIEEAIKADLDF